MKTLAIVVRDDGFDRLLTPLAFAYTQASQGVQVDMLFTLWAVRALTEAGAKALRIDGRHASEEGWLKARLAQQGAPSEIHDYLRVIKQTGNVRLYACQLAATSFEVDETSLIAEAEGIANPTWFLNERAMKADHCQYF